MTEIDLCVMKRVQHPIRNWRRVVDCEMQTLKKVLKEHQIYKVIVKIKEEED